MQMLKRIAKAFMPYGLVIAIRKRIQSNDSSQSSHISPCNLFMQEVKEYIGGKKVIQYDKDSKFRYIVSVQGFGRTGSSAIVDLLREYSSTVVIGYLDPVNSKATKNKLSDEITLVRESGSLSEIEKYIGTTNRFNQDAVLHRFILLVTNSLIYKNCPDTRPFFYRFFADITKIQEPIPDQRYYNKHLYYNDNIDILSLKKLTISQYRQIVKSFLISVFNTFHTNDKEILVLDQFFLDSDYSYSVQKEIIPNIKMIVSIRDPRDVFSLIKKTNVKWIPYNNPYSFIEWYKDREILLDDDNEIKKTVRFEDLLVNYDETVDDIEKYLELKAVHHTSKFSCFDPKISINGYLLWKEDNGDDKDYSLIERELRFLCYPQSIT